LGQNGVLHAELQVVKGCWRIDAEMQTSNWCLVATQSFEKLVLAKEETFKRVDDESK
jgi:hypothetical protein